MKPCSWRMKLYMVICLCIHILSFFILILKQNLIYSSTSGWGEPKSSRNFQNWSFIIHSVNKTTRAIMNPKLRNRRADTRPCKFTKAGLRISASIAWRKFESVMHWIGFGRYLLEMSKGLHTEERPLVAIILGTGMSSLKGEYWNGERKSQ